MDKRDWFCEEIKRNENAMYKVAFSVLNNDDLVSDSLSESVLKAYTKIDTLKNKENFKAWILKIVHNTCIETIRKNQFTVDIDEQTEIFHESSDNKSTTKIVLRDAVLSLKQPYRTVTVLFYYECLPVKDIAKITGDSVANVKKQLERARNMLKEILQKEDFFGE